ncbi:glutathione S-transferase N-terminal domain-containing protein [Neisseriaceae bacterium ESL0693]|nr:glutathione S-transferase N-terminal domain-containing protein [Neisseriaceae bacterium ESL0693]
MLKLYYLPNACSTVPHVALEWSGLTYTAQAVEHEEIKSAKYLALNPQGQVPVLVDGDWALTQNMAIIDYINDLAPNSHIFSVEGDSDVRIRARARQWLAFANSDLHPAFDILFGATRLIDGEQAQTDLQAHAAKKVLSLYEKVEQALQHQDYLAGNSISIADVYVFVTMRWAGALALDLSPFTRLADLRNRVQANAGVQHVLKQEGLL